MSDEFRRGFGSPGLTSEISDSLKIVRSENLSVFETRSNGIRRRGESIENSVVGSISDGVDVL